MNATQKQQRMRLGRIAWFSAAVAILILFAPPLSGAAAPNTRGKGGAVESADYLPGMNLVDQNGRALSLASLKGRPVLVAFIHASCQGACQMLTARMKLIAQTLGPDFQSKVTMVSITTDPAHDGPAQMLAYAKEEGTNGDGWLFLCGKPRTVARILALYKVPEEEPGEAMTHDFDLFLLRPDGRQVRHYNGMKIAPGVVASEIRKTAARQ